MGITTYVDSVPTVGVAGPETWKWLCDLEFCSCAPYTKSVLVVFRDKVHSIINVARVIQLREQPSILQLFIMRDDTFNLAQLDTAVRISKEHFSSKAVLTTPQKRHRELLNDVITRNNK